MTKDKLVALAFETEAPMVPPPCWLKFTSGVAPFAVKFAPVIVTSVPKEADAGLKPAIVGAGITVKLAPLLTCPATVTTILPVVAPLGTGTTMLVALQLVGVALVPLKLTVLVPCVVPKVVPVTATVVPTPPDDGERLVMLGVTVKLIPLLATPETVTTTLPVVAPFGTGNTMLVALQLVDEPDVPLNVTVLVPCEEPKFVPVIVTDVPTAPEVGDKLVTLGDVPPPLLGLNVAKTAPHGSVAVIDAVAEIAPAVVCNSSSAKSFVHGSAGTLSAAD
jgi:hypothetical protein